MTQANLHSITALAPVAAIEATSTFNFEGTPLRTVTFRGEPWFLAADVCAAVSLSNPSMSVQSLDPDERAKFNLGHQGEATYVSEGGLYTLVLRNRKATTPGTTPHRFRRWVTGEVLPAIRRTGSYGAPAPVPAFDPNDPAALRTLLIGYTEKLMLAQAETAEARQAQAFAEVVVEEQRPKVEAFEAFLDDRGLCNLRAAARAVDAPSQLFIDWLKDCGYVFRENGDLQPSAAMRRDGYMKLRAGPDAGGKLRNQTLVTRAGLEWLRQRWHVGPGKVLRLQAALAEKQGRLAV